MSETVEINTKKLDQLIKAFGGKLPIARVGVLGSKVARNATGPNNATIGAVHEFGAPNKNIPPRSFLRGPLSDLLQKQMEQSGAFDKDVLNQVIADRSIKAWVKLMASLAEKIVAEAFTSNGYGKWPAWKPGYTNNTGDILVDTGQLSKSITSEVKDG